MFDPFYKIVSLYQLGYEITLHCFEYGRGEQPELNKYCSKVYYYKRRTGIKGFSFQLPYIVSSRINDELIKNLSRDQSPILIEGTHGTYLLYKNLFPGRKIILRLHNIEQLYYRQLAFSERNLFKKLYYYIESRLLKTYEREAAERASLVLTVSEADAKRFHEYCPGVKTEYLPVFLPFNELTIDEGKGDFCLYHGNLSVAENEQAAIRIIRNYPFRNNLPLIIAGKNPSAHLNQVIKRHDHVKLIANPSNKLMEQLIRQAHIHIVWSLNATGIKLKLLHALFHGRHCVLNQAALPGPEFGQLCILLTSAKELKQVLVELKELPFTQKEIELRRQVLHSQFNNAQNALHLSELL
jgi:hypothetical protein